MTVFLRWWLIACLSILATVFGFIFGMFDYFWKVDVTKLSIAAIGLYAIMTVFVGSLTYDAREGHQDFQKHLSLCWYTSELMLGLGMIGTLAGFLYLLNAAFGANIDLSAASSVKKVLSEMAVGFATAGVTTLVGLTCSLCLKLQLVNLEYMLEE